MQLEVRFSAGILAKFQGSPIECVDQMAEAETVFGQTVCGCCKTAGAKMQVRRWNGFDGLVTFREAKCQSEKCGAALGFYEYKGKLLPSLTNKDKSLKPNGGWAIYQKRDGGSQEPAREPQDYGQEDPNSIPF